MDQCDYPGCFFTPSVTVGEKRLCPGHGTEYRTFLIYYGWAAENIRRMERDNARQ